MNKIFYTAFLTISLLIHLQTKAQCIMQVEGVTIDATCATDSNGYISITITDGTFPFVFLWSNGMTTQDIEYLFAGSYEVTVTDADSCIATNIFTVGSPDQFEVVVEIDSAVFGIWELIAYALGGTPPYTYLWSNGGTGESIMVAPGDYSISVVDANGCYSYTDVTVVSAPCGILFTTTYDTTNNQFNLILDSAVQAQFALADYYWDFGDGGSSTSQFPTHTYTSNDIYNVCLTISDSITGASCDYCHNIGIDSAGNIITRLDLVGFTMQVVPYNFNGGNEINQTEFNIYPNPVDENAVVSFYSDKAAVYTIDIINVLGQHVKTISLNAASGNNLLKLPVNDLVNGMYLVNLHFKSKIISQIFIK